MRVLSFILANDLNNGLVTSAYNKYKRINERRYIAHFYLNDK